MARTKKNAAPADAAKMRDVEAYTHDDKKRTKNPPVGIARHDKAAKTVNTYQFEPHLDPTLQWAGKAEGMSVDVPTSSKIRKHTDVAETCPGSKAKRNPSDDISALIEAGVLEVIKPTQKKKKESVPGAIYLITPRMSGSSYSIKPGNIRINWKKIWMIDALKESTIGATTAEGVDLKTILIQTLLRIAVRMIGALLIKITADQAIVLVALWRRHDATRVVSFPEALALTNSYREKLRKEPESEASLRNVLGELDRIKVISLRGNSIELIETISKDFYTHAELHKILYEQQWIYEDRITVKPLFLN